MSNRYQSGGLGNLCHHRQMHSMQSALYKLNTLPTLKTVCIHRHLFERFSAYAFIDLDVGLPLEVN